VNCDGFKAILRSVERGRTWVKLSAGYRLSSPEAAKLYAREFLKIAGPDRLFWGSDWPFAAFEDEVKYRDTVDSFFDWIPDPAARRKIGGETAFKFYFS
jgi:predicted TIM-barrel fold metal-dependent hydrolase